MPRRKGLCGREDARLFLKIQGCVSSSARGNRQENLPQPRLFLREFQKAVLNQVLIRAGREDQAMMTTLAGILVVLFLIVDMIYEFFETVKTMFQF